MKGKKSKRGRPPAKRNPLARQLADPRYRKRVTKDAGSYNRRPKHAKPTAGEESEDGGQ